MSNKPYTRTGDTGQTQLGSQRVTKDHPIIHLMGTLDELNSVVGICPNFNKFRTWIQGDLYRLMGHLHRSMVPGYASHFFPIDTTIEHMESDIDELWPVGGLSGFIPPRSYWHVARTICRKAERQAVSMQHSTLTSVVTPDILQWLNRLSDLLYAIGVKDQMRPDDHHL